jgi:hypothetical protein
MRSGCTAFPRTARTAKRCMHRIEAGYARIYQERKWAMAGCRRGTWPCGAHGLEHVAMSVVDGRLKSV